MKQILEKVDDDQIVASSREDAWIETGRKRLNPLCARSRPPARTRGLKPSALLHTLFQVVASSREDAWIETYPFGITKSYPASRPPARTRGLKLNNIEQHFIFLVASSREDAWIETAAMACLTSQVCGASSREDAGIETHTALIVNL